MKTEVGALYKSRQLRRPVEWFVGGRWPPFAHGVHGMCFVGRIGQVFNMSSSEFVPEDEVPDEIWAALAKFRLTQ